MSNDRFYFMTCVSVHNVREYNMLVCRPIHVITNIVAYKLVICIYSGFMERI